jgi:hypothetical protein
MASAVASILTETYITQLIEFDPGVNLQELLTDTQPLFDDIVDDDGDRNSSIWLDALPVLPVDYVTRKHMNQLLKSAAEGETDIMYIFVLFQEYIVISCRQSDVPDLHPTDMALLFYWSKWLKRRSFEGDIWVPICLKELDGASFVYLHLCPTHSGLDLLFLNSNAMKSQETFCTKRNLLNVCNLMGYLDQLRQNIIEYQLPEFHLRDELNHEADSFCTFIHAIIKWRRFKRYVDIPWSGLEECIWKTLMAYYKRIHYRLHHFHMKSLVFQTTHYRIIGQITDTFEVYITYSLDIPRNTILSTLPQFIRWLNVHRPDFID